VKEIRWRPDNSHGHARVVGNIGPFECAITWGGHTQFGTTPHYGTFNGVSVGKGNTFEECWLRILAQAECESKLLADALKDLL
jgi:hypothetical protein